MLLYDQYDIWRVDPTGNAAPENLTGGYGLSHKMEFHLEKDNPGALQDNQRLLLSAFDLRTKRNGFYSKILGKRGTPELLTMGQYLYDWIWVDQFTPLKARDANIYLVRRMSTTEAPNYYLTHDFRTYLP